MKPYVILVTGYRKFPTQKIPMVSKALDEAMTRGQTSLHRCIVVVTGGAKGLDTIAGLLAQKKGVYVIDVHALWGEYGVAAGPERNQLMLDLFDVDEALAFPLRKSRGTFDMMDRLADAGIMTTNVTGVGRKEKSNGR